MTVPVAKDRPNPDIRQSRMDTEQGENQDPNFRIGTFSSNSYAFRRNSYVTEIRSTIKEDIRWGVASITVPNRSQEGTATAHAV
jgi:hypothetical protein